MNSQDLVRSILRTSPCPHFRVLGDPERAIRRVWAYSGPGPRRFGWWSIGVAGHATYLGRTVQEVREKLAEVERMWGEEP